MVIINKENFPYHLELKCKGKRMKVRKNKLKTYLYIADEYSSTKYW